MNNKHYVGKRVASLESYGRTRPVDGVALLVDDEHEYQAGDQTGYVLEIECPYGTQAMADALMEKLGGKSYTGYTAVNAVMDPEAELGDGVTVGGGYELLASRQMTIGSGHLGQIGAPPDSETDHEYGVADPYMRQIDRKLAQTRSYIEKTSEEIKLGIEDEMNGRLGEITLRIDGVEATFKDELEGLSAEFKAGIDGVESRLTSDMDGRFSEFRQDLDGFSAKVQGLEGRVGSLELTDSKLLGRIEGAEGDIGTLELTATKLSGRIESAEGDIGSLELTAKSLASSIESANGDISTLKQTAKTLESDIMSANGEISTLKQTASGLTSTVGTLTGTGSGSIGSMIQQQIDKIKLTVTGELGGKASITLSGGGGGSGSIDLSGVRKAFANDDSNITISAGTVTFNAGKFISNGMNFKVDAEGILKVKKAIATQMSLQNDEVGWPFPYGMGSETALACKGDIDLIPYKYGVDYSGTIYGYTNYSSQKLSLVYASHLEGKDWSCLGFNGNVYVRGERIKMSVPIDETSDRDLKKDIAALDGRYLAFLDAISPISFRYKRQADDAPVYVGYIAQDVEAALGGAGLTRGDFAGLVGTDGEGDMGLGYTQFIPILHLKINDLEKRLKRLEAAS